MGLFSSKSSSTSVSSTTAVSQNLADTSGQTITGNEGAVTILDGGAIGEIADVSKSVVELAGELTMDFLEKQKEASMGFLEFAKSTQDQANSFAIAGANPNAAVTSETQKIILVVGGLIAAGMAWKMAKG